MTITEAEMGERTFGCEIECVGIDRESAARTVARVTGGTATFEGTHLNNWVVAMPDGRKWQVVSDMSIGSGAEVVTPILRWEDIEILKAVVRALRANGARANWSTGLHIHVGAADFGGREVKNLVRTFYKQEELILKAAGTYSTRIAEYTHRTDHAFVDRICRMRNPTMERVADAYYAGPMKVGRSSHYCSARYRALNLHNLWNGSKHTVEYRFWNGTVNEDEVMAAVQLCLLITIRAKTATASSAKNPRPYSAVSAKYDFRVFLLRLGANGPTFRKMRKLLMRNLPGSAAWKNGRRD